MKILTIHNKYQHRGGEDEVRDAEDQLLQSRGHQVRSLTFDNAGIGGFGAALIGLSTPWSQASYRRVAGEIASWRPDIVNVHNFFPLATPAVHYAAASAGVPVVQTLHNFRTLCPSGVLFREGKPCEECIGKVVPWPGIVHACYRESHIASAAVAAMNSVHNVMKTWQTQVTLFFALTEFARQKFIQGGFPSERLVVKPNFVGLDLGPGLGHGDFIFYAGRLSEEKGIPLLLNAWRTAKPNGRLLLAGDGPLTPLVEEFCRRDHTIQYLGRLPLAETYRYMGDARAFVFPSLWYEGMPRAIIEAFSRGTPVIANRLGSMTEMIRHQETGWLVDSGDCGAFACALSFAFTDQFDHARVRSEARAEFERNYTADRQYELLMTAYQHAIDRPIPTAAIHECKPHPI
jgi:glycosyltransferase involved in cell wall biosynthesis